MNQPQYKNDIKLTYDAKTKIVKARWTDWECAARGMKGNSRYKSRSIKVDEYTTRKEAEEELLNIAQIEQRASIERAEALFNKVEHGEVPVETVKVPVATVFLRKLKDHHVTSSKREKTIRDARKALTYLIEWLDKNYPNILLNKITKLIAEEFFKWYAGSFAFSSTKTCRAYLVFTFNTIIDIFEEAPFKILNPFSRVTLKKVLDDTAENRKSIFTIEELSFMLKRAGESKYIKEPERMQRFVMFYLLMITGWRVGDIADMTWDAVNFNKRYIINLHNKTVKTTGVQTKIYMTDMMERLLKLLQSYDRPKEFDKFIFSVGREGVADLHQRIITNTQTHINNIREELHLNQSSKKGKNDMHSYTTHSIRGSFITHMAGEGHSEILIDYIVGHNLSSVNAKHYSRFDSDPEKFTRSIIEDMERLLDVRGIFDILRSGKKVHISSDSPMIDNTAFFYKLSKEDNWSQEAIKTLKEICHEHPLEMRERAVEINEYKKQKRRNKVTVTMIADFMTSAGSIRR